MAIIVIVVEGGLVQEVFSTEKDTDVELLDFDTEEGQAAEADIKMPEHKVWRYTYYQQETAQIRQLWGLRTKSWTLKFVVSRLFCPQK